MNTLEWDNVGGLASLGNNTPEVPYDRRTLAGQSLGYSPLD